MQAKGTKRGLWILVVVMMLSLAVPGLASAHAPTAPPASTYCGALGEYTAWHWTGSEWKAVLWVWNNGRSAPYPRNLVVFYDKRTVPNGQKGVQTSGNPQVDQNNGWVGYFISKTWMGGHWGWDDDSRWKVTGCVEQ